MGAAAYESVYVAAAAAEKADSTDRAALTSALTTISVPELVESQQGGAITFANEHREAQFNLFMEQLHWDEAKQELRPKIIWPAELMEMEFQIPDWYRPSGA